MEVEICSPRTLKSFPDLREELESAVALSDLDTDELKIRVLCGDFLDPYYDWVLWKLDPRGLRLRRCIARYGPPRIIEMDIALGCRKPRLQTIIRYFFHELGHYKDYLEGFDMGKWYPSEEKRAESFATIMMKRWREKRSVI